MTAYEMRISDWSSDVCSSDLLDERPLPLTGELDDDPLGNRRAQRHATSQLSAGHRLGKGGHHEDPALLILRRRQPFLTLQRDPPACALEPFDDAPLHIVVAVARCDGYGGVTTEGVGEAFESR